MLTQRQKPRADNLGYKSTVTCDRQWLQKIENFLFISAMPQSTAILQQLVWTSLNIQRWKNFIEWIQMLGRNRVLRVDGVGRIFQISWRDF